jgi:RHS repeat-associated protein
MSTVASHNRLSSIAAAFLLAASAAHAYAPESHAASPDNHAVLGYSVQFSAGPARPFKNRSRFLTEYRFDARGRLRRVTDKLASVPRYDSLYDYYPDGRRARKTVSVHTNNVWQLARTHRYLYDRWNLIQETINNHQSSIVNRHFTWGLDLSGLSSGTWSQQAGGIGGLLAITEVAGASTNVYLPVCDQVGTVHALVAAVTNSVPVAEPFVAARYEYSPYGELLEVLPDPGLFTVHRSLFTSPPFGFQTKLRDPETGFWYFGHRFFDSRCAQWLTHDPLREEGGYNLAAFCGGDPVNAVDPLGLWFDEFRATVGLGIGASTGNRASWQLTDIGVTSR